MILDKAQGGRPPRRSLNIKAARKSAPTKKQRKVPPALQYAVKLEESMLEHGSIEKATAVYMQQQQHYGKNVSYTPCQVARMYCEFMTLKILNGDFQASTSKLSPGEYVDEFWHAHVLDTAGYSEFFKDVLPPLGPMVHHDAAKSQDSDDEIAERQQNTREAYEKVFGGTCPFFNHENENPHQVVPVEILGNRLTIDIKTSFGTTFKDVEVGADNTIEDLKAIIQTLNSLPPKQQRLIFAGETLFDGNTLADCGIIDGSTIMMILIIRGC